MVFGYSQVYMRAKSYNTIGQVLPEWTIEFRRWGKPADVARRLDVPCALVLSAYKGDESAYAILRAGTASKTGKKLNLYSCAFVELSDNRRRRPQWMSPTMWHKLFSIFPVAKQVAE